MSETVHMCMNIDSLLSRGVKSLHGLIFDSQGRKMSGREVRAWLLSERDKGRQVLPFGDPCEGFDYIAGCPGHGEAWYVQSRGRGSLSRKLVSS